MNGKEQLEVVIISALLADPTLMSFVSLELTDEEQQAFSYTWPVHNFNQILDVLIESTRRDYLISVYEKSLSQLRGSFDVDSVVADTSSAVLQRQNMISNLVSADSLLTDTLDEIESDGAFGAPIGLKDLREAVPAFMNGGLTILAGRPSAGKTAFGLQAVKWACQEDEQSGIGKVLFFTLEMTTHILMCRLLATTSQVAFDRLVTKSLDAADWERIAENGLTIGKWGVFFEENPNIANIIKEIRYFALKEKISLVVIDYLQLISTYDKFNTTHEKFTGIINKLKSIAKEYKIPVLLLSQISRDVEKHNRDPRLADLSESGAIETVADTVLFLVVKSTNPPMKEIEIIVEKNRVKPSARVKVNFNGKTQEFSDCD